MGIVSVWPGKLPAKVIVAPNSPSARAQHNTAPAPREGAMSGTVTRRNTVIRFAPSVAAASSPPGSGLDVARSGDSQPPNTECSHTVTIRLRDCPSRLGHELATTTRGGVVK